VRRQIAGRNLTGLRGAIVVAAALATLIAATFSRHAGEIALETVARCGPARRSRTRAARGWTTRRRAAVIGTYPGAVVGLGGTGPGAGGGLIYALAMTEFLGRRTRSSASGSITGRSSTGDRGTRGARGSATPDLMVTDTDRAAEVGSRTARRAGAAASADSLGAVGGVRGRPLARTVARSDADASVGKFHVQLAARREDQGSDDDGPSVRDHVHVSLPHDESCGTVVQTGAAYRVNDGCTRTYNGATLSG
jgi:hypothetical protein